MLNKLYKFMLLPVFTLCLFLGFSSFHNNVRASSHINVSHNHKKHLSKKVHHRDKIYSYKEVSNYLSNNLIKFINSERSKNDLPRLIFNRNLSKISKHRLSYQNELDDDFNSTHTNHGGDSYPIRGAVSDGTSMGIFKDSESVNRDINELQQNITGGGYSKIRYRISNLEYSLSIFKDDFSLPKDNVENNVSDIVLNGKYYGISFNVKKDGSILMNLITSSKKY